MVPPLDDEGAYHIGDFKPGEEAVLTYRLKLLDDIDLGKESREGVIVSDCYVGNDLRVTSTSFTVTKERKLESIASTVEDTGEHSPSDNTFDKDAEKNVVLIYSLIAMGLILLIAGLFVKRRPE